MTNLPTEIRETIFIEIEPKTLLQKLGMRTAYLEIGNHEHPQFTARKISINQLNHTASFEVAGEYKKVDGISNTPIPLTDQILENLLTRSRLVYISS